MYADRPRSAWRRVGRELLMSTDPLDVRGLERAAGATTWTGMPPGTVIGHVHLHVGDLAIASDFFGEALGFDTTVWDYLARCSSRRGATIITSAPTSGPDVMRNRQSKRMHSCWSGRSNSQIPHCWGHSPIASPAPAGR